MKLSIDSTNRLKRVVCASTALAFSFAGAAVLTSTAADAAPSPTHVLRPADFDFTGTYAGGHNVFGVNGIRVTTDNSNQAEASGSFDLNKPLADIGEPSFQWIPTKSAADDVPPGMLMNVDFNGNGAAADEGYLIGERAYADKTTGIVDWWGPSSTPESVKALAPSCHGKYTAGQTYAEALAECDGGSGSPWHGTLDQWRAAFGGARVLTGGYNLGSGIQNDGTLVSLTFANTTYTFTNQLIKNATIRSADFIKAQSDTRANGHAVFEANDLHVYTDGNSDVVNGTNQDKAAEYFALNPKVALIHAGQPELAWTGSAARPGNQLVIDFTGDGTEASPEYGTLVGEPVYGDDYWLTNGSNPDVKAHAPSCFDPIDGTTPLPNGCTGGSGSAWHGTLADWSRQFPNATILEGGFSLGSGVKGDGKITSIDVGDTTYTFANTAPTAGNVSASTTINQPVAITLTGNDIDAGQTLTYAYGTPTHGSVTGTGSAITYTPTTGYTGPDSFTYTVDDGEGGTATGTVSVTVSAVTVDVHAPATVAIGAATPVAFDGTTTNPAGGTTIPHARYDIALTGDDGLTSGQITLQYSVDGTNYATVPLTGSTANGGSITGYFGPQGGFPFPVGSKTTQFRVSIASGAPGGALTAKVSLVDVNQTDNSAQDVLGSDTDTIELVAASSVSATVTPTPLTSGDTPVVHAIVGTDGSSAGGTVTVTGADFTASAPVTAGKADITLPKLPGGSQTLTVSYSGTASSAPSSTTTTVSVAKTATQIAVAFSPANPTVAQGVKVLVTVTSAGAVDGGTVTAVIHSQTVTGTVSGGKVTLALGKEPVGANTVRVVFNGSAAAAASPHVYATLTVAKAPTTLTVATSPAKITTTTTGAKAIITVSAPGAVVNGARATIAGVGYATVVSGKATVALPGRLSKGKHTYQVGFAGTATAAQVITTFSFTVS